MQDAEGADGRDFTGLMNAMKASSADKVTNTSGHTGNAIQYCLEVLAIRATGISVVEDIRLATV